MNQTQQNNVHDDGCEVSRPLISMSRSLTISYKTPCGLTPSYERKLVLDSRDSLVTPYYFLFLLSSSWKSSHWTRKQRAKKTGLCIFVKRDPGERWLVYRTQKIRPQTIVYLLGWQEKVVKIVNNRPMLTCWFYLIEFRSMEKRIGEDSTESVSMLRLLCLLRRAAGEQGVEKVWACDEGFSLFEILELRDALPRGRCVRISKSWRRSKPSGCCLGTQVTPEKTADYATFRTETPKRTIYYRSHIED